MKKYLIKDATIVNEGKEFQGDVLIKGQRIEKIGDRLQDQSAEEINAEGMTLIPGVIDDQVHFREPGLTHKADIYTESKAAVAGGITSYMEMPNTIPNTLTQKLLEEKYQRASQVSLANYSFFMGVSNSNSEEVLRTDPKTVCGIKIFMGSSTGDMLVDNVKTLEKLFSTSPLLIATHCEDEQTIKNNLEKFKLEYGDKIQPKMHPLIRNAEACYKSSSFAVQLAEKYGTRLHILHISTGVETDLFKNDKPLAQKKITSEVCIHHLWFDDRDYDVKGNFIKWNPAVKTQADKSRLWEALLDDRIDVIATDHAPHTLEEKLQPYLAAPSGGPLVQHALVAMLEHYHENKITLPRLVEKMAHAPAVCFQINERGFIREGYYADLVLINMTKPWVVSKENILYKCSWSPFEGQLFRSCINQVFVNGHRAYYDGCFDESLKGNRLEFNR